MTRSQNARQDSAKTPWMDVAFSYEGTREIRGSRHNPVIVKFFQDAGFPNIKDDETAWCAAYMNAVLYESGIQGTRSLLARSFLKWGDKVTAPQYGDICVIRRGSKSWQGHVFFFIRFEGDFVVGLGGNQSDMVNVARFPKSAVLGYRRVPKNPGIPQIPEITQEDDSKIVITPTNIGVTLGGILSSVLTFIGSDVGTALIVLTVFGGIVAYLMSRR